MQISNRKIQDVSGSFTVKKHRPGPVKTLAVIKRMYLFGKIISALSKTNMSYHRLGLNKFVLRMFDRQYRARGFADNFFSYTPYQNMRQSSKSVSAHDDKFHIPIASSLYYLKKSVSCN